MKQKELEAIHAVTPPHEPTVLALADIARQLTRIADLTEPVRMYPDIKPAPNALTTIAGIILKDFSSRLPQNIVERLEAALPAEEKS